MTSLAMKFEDYHAENPQIYVLFDRFAKEALISGRKTLSAKMIFERIRWETQVVTGSDSYKVNNNYHAYYARKWMKDNGRDGLFRIRRVGS